MTDGGFAQTDLIAAAEASALALATAFGLGDEVRAGESWTVDEGDMVIAAPLSGGATGRLVLGVNDVVGKGLLADPDALQTAFTAAAMALGDTLGTNFEIGPIAPMGDTLPTVSVDITNAGVLTALAGLTLPVAAVMAPAVDFEPGAFDEDPEPIDSYALASLSVLNDVELIVTAELGRTTMAVRDLLRLSPGMVVEIDRVAGSPIDLLVNGRRIAAGEVVVIDEEFGIRITDIAPIGDRRR